MTTTARRPTLRPSHIVHMALVLALLLPAALLPPGGHALARPGTHQPAATPSHPLVSALYAGTDQGQVFRSLDDGATWHEADAGLPTGSRESTNALAMTPGMLNNEIYAGTNGHGMFFSGDYGRTWGQSNGGDPTMAASRITAIALDPHSLGQLYVATSSGTLYRSGDRGFYWIKQWTSPDRYIGAIAVDGLRSTTLFAGTSTGIFLSTDYGRTWKSVYAGPSLHAIAVDPVNPDVAYAVGDGPILQTSDGGATWQAHPSTALAAASYSSVAVDPASHTHVIAAALDGVVYTSTDGGARWQRKPLGQAGNTAVAFGNARPGTVVVGSAIAGRSALNVSRDAGLTWKRATTLTAHNVRSLASSGPLALPTAPERAPTTSPGSLYFAKTHHLVSPLFAPFYRRGGGLAVFGLPLTRMFLEGVSTLHPTQYFERAGLVFLDSGVMILPLGSLVSAGQVFPRVPPAPSTSASTYFPATGHTLSGRFLTFWRTYGGDSLFGPPISQPFFAQNDDGTGRSYLVQYCQNARFEDHPELAGTGYEVQLGLLGREYLHLRDWL